MPSVWANSRQSCKCRHKLGAEPGPAYYPEQSPGCNGIPKQHSTCQEAVYGPTGTEPVGD